MRALEVALFVLALALAGLVSFALLWSGEAPYRDLARANSVDHVTFITNGPGGPSDVDVDLDTLVGWHKAWSSYVTGGSAEPPVSFGREVFTADEYAHMADVRRVFETARFLIPVSLLVIIIRLQRARARSPRAMWQLVRDASLIAAAVVVLIGIVATFAFEPLFLAFHYVFFPQGNFLFDPATSNLIRLYPDWYWQGMSLRVGLSFIAVALGLVAGAGLRIRAAK
jgi:integral membrane protein (TIGR01906 family)